VVPPKPPLPVCNRDVLPVQGFSQDEEYTAAVKKILQ
jgi:hypothetical protein